MLAHLVPHGRNATIPAVLRHHGYPLRLEAPGPGKLVISWLLKASRTERAVVLARDHVTFSSTGIRDVFVRLTLAGDRVLSNATGLVMTIHSTLTVRGNPPIAVRMAVQLRR